jgi:hypothetical protein
MTVKTKNSKENTMKILTPNEMKKYLEDKNLTNPTEIKFEFMKYICKFEETVEGALEILRNYNQDEKFITELYNEVNFN